ncbi:unnamed protein product, partial [Oppiella nova]
MEFKFFSVCLVFIPLIHGFGDNQHNDWNRNGLNKRDSMEWAPNDAPNNAGPNVGHNVGPNIVHNVPLPPNCDNIGRRAVKREVDSFPTLANYYMNDSYSDIKLGLNNDTKIPAHKLILSAKSKYFEKLFLEDPLKQEFDIQDMVASEGVF